MLGALLLVLAFLLFIPALLTTMGVLAAALGTFLTKDAEERYAGSELIALNK